jgi:hypothetical protein
MAMFGAQSFNPAQVMMNPPQATGVPYVGKPKPPIRRAPGEGGQPPMPLAPKQPMPTPKPPVGVLAPESVRATGTGPFSSDYRQNLATYAGSQFSRPGGSMNFNPTDPSTFPGQPTGGGTAPVTGMPNSLLDMALGGQGFSWTSPQPAQTATSPGDDLPNMANWLDQFMQNGRGQRFGSPV